LPGLTNVPFVICEMNPGLGANAYTLDSVSITATPFSVFDIGGGVGNPVTLTPPLYSANDGGANTGICFDVLIQPGTQTFEIHADNERPGGTRTIGYWANWTTCDGKGNQVDVAAKNGGPDAGFWLLDDVLGILDIGLADPLNCPSAVDLLKKSEINNPNVIGDGANRANDGAYGMAAQLIAAEANYGAGAIACPNATTAISRAKTLLNQILFTGNGAYLTPKPGINLSNYSAVRNYALGLAGVLDAYNNLEDVGTCASVPAPPAVVTPVP